MSHSRRDFIARLGTLGSLAALSGSQPFAGLLHAGSPNALPAPASSGIDHVVLVMMENRSFDHFLGWLPKANGRQAGLSYPDTQGSMHPTYHLTTYEGCQYADPDHSYSGARIQFDNGRCDGWLRAGTNDLFPIGYYTQTDLPFMGQAATHWTVCANYFAGILGPTYPNRLYQHAAATDRLDNSTTVSNLPTIWDRLAAAGLTGRYFYNDIPFTALWGSRYLGISRPISEFFSLAAVGQLPQCSYIDPRFEDENSGSSNDDHPHADIRNGEIFLNQIYQAVTSSPAWDRTILIINFDEGGGFFDHVPPPLKPIPPTDQQVGSDGRIGFRVPALIISPFARRNSINFTQFDHTSVLKLIEWRWNLDPLTVRDAGANNLASVLNFNSPSLFAPSFNVPQGPFTNVCTSGLPVSESSEWQALALAAQTYGFPIL
jgi:phospholipase C